jgi:hypothetical protein
MAVFHEIYSAAIGGAPDDWADRDQSGSLSGSLQQLAETEAFFGV